MLNRTSFHSKAYPIMAGQKQPLTGVKGVFPIKKSVLPRLWAHLVVKIKSIYCFSILNVLWFLSHRLRERHELYTKRIKKIQFQSASVVFFMSKVF